MTPTGFREAVITIQMEYVEMPELKLTLPQAQRLWTLPTDICQAAMAALVATGFLVHTRDGAYLRRGTPPVHVEALDSLTWAVGSAGAGSDGLGGPIGA
jgi:hypothetical protein